MVMLWHAVYGLYLWVSNLFPCNAAQLSTCSWEFFTTLDYEWMVFRGHIRYRWTIWVRVISNTPCFPLTYRTGLFFGTRYTLSLAWLVLWGRYFLLLA